MKRSLKTWLVSLLAIGSFSLHAATSQDLTRPTLMFLELKRALIQTNISWEDKSDLETKKNIDKYFSLLEDLKRLQSFSNDYGAFLNGQLKNGDVLDGQQMHVISGILSSYQGFALKLLEFASLYNVSHLENPEQLINSNDNAATTKNLLWLSAHITIYDNVLDGYNTYFKNGVLRRIFKDVFATDAKLNKNLEELREMVATTASKKNRRALSKHLRIFQNNHHSLTDRSSEIKRLVNLISSTKASRDLLSTTPASIEAHNGIDKLVSSVNNAMNAVSGVFGNAAGAVRWRHGHFYNNPAAHKAIISQLRPLDIILERTPFALTDLFIPGNFGHVALWLGTPEQLKEVGLWNHPAIIPYQKEIEGGKYILEAVRPGVRLNTLEEFLEIDEIAIIRQNNVFNDKLELNDIVTRAMSQIGKDYDFNFDVATTTKIVCSELIYHSFGRIKWPTKYIMGRATISPDQVAELALWSDTPVDFEFYLYSPKRDDIRRLSINDFANNLSYVPNEELSTTMKPAFDKKVRRCRKVSMRVNMGSNRFRAQNEKREYNYCSTERKHYTYEPGATFDNTEYGY
jgi:hypothetical protein